MCNVIARYVDRGLEPLVPQPLLILLGRMASTFQPTDRMLSVGMDKTYRLARSIEGARQAPQSVPLAACISPTMCVCITDPLLRWVCVTSIYVMHYKPTIHVLPSIHFMRYQLYVCAGVAQVYHSMYHPVQTQRQVF